MGFRRSLASDVGFETKRARAAFGRRVARTIGSLVSLPFRAPGGATAEWHRRACFRTRRGGRGEHCEPCAATSGAPMAVNALNTDNRVCACIRFWPAHDYAATARSHKCKQAAGKRSRTASHEGSRPRTRRFHSLDRFRRAPSSTFFLILLANDRRIELLKPRNQLYATRGRTQSCLVVPVDSSCPACCCRCGFSFLRKIQRCRGAGARLWLVEALCVSRTHRTTRKSWPAFLAN